MKNKISKLCQNSREIFAKIINDESGQGLTEYIFLVVVVVAIAMAFRTQITEAIKSKLDSVSSDISSFGK